MLANTFPESTSTIEPSMSASNRPKGRHPKNTTNKKKQCVRIAITVLVNEVTAQHAKEKDAFKGKNEMFDTLTTL